MITILFPWKRRHICNLMDFVWHPLCGTNWYQRQQKIQSRMTLSSCFASRTILKMHFCGPAWADKNITPDKRPVINDIIYIFLVICSHHSHPTASVNWLYLVVFFFTLVCLHHYFSKGRWNFSRIFEGVRIQNKFQADDRHVELVSNVEILFIGSVLNWAQIPFSDGCGGWILNNNCPAVTNNLKSPNAS